MHWFCFIEGFSILAYQAVEQNHLAFLVEGYDTGNIFVKSISKSMQWFRRRSFRKRKLTRGKKTTDLRVI